MNNFASAYKANSGNLEQPKPGDVYNTARTMKALQADAREVSPTMLSVLESGAKESGGVVFNNVMSESEAGDVTHESLLKTETSLRDKIEVRGKGPHEVGDAVRGMVVVPTVDKVRDATSAMVASVEAHGGKVIAIEDRYATPLPTGYVGVHLDVTFQTAAGHTIRAEIQVHDHDHEAKEVSHGLYKTYRSKYGDKKYPPDVESKNRRVYADFYTKYLSEHP